MIHSLSELVLPTSLILLSRSQLLNNILNCRSSSILVKLLIVASKRTLIYVFRFPIVWIFLFPLLPRCSPKSLSNSEVAQYKTDPELFPHLVRLETNDDAQTKGGDFDPEESNESKRQKRRILVRTKTPIKSEIVRPDLNFVSNGKPLKQAVKQSVIELPTSTSTTAAPLANNTNSTTNTPFSWLASVFPFNGLPTNIFSLSPMQWMGSTLFGNVVNHSQMGPHVLL